MLCLLSSYFKALFNNPIKSFRSLNYIPAGCVSVKCLDWFGVVLMSFLSWCHAVPSSPQSTMMRSATNEWTAPSQSCMSPSCRKANALSSTHKIHNTCTITFLSHFHVLSFYIPTLHIQSTFPV